MIVLTFCKAEDSIVRRAYEEKIVNTNDELIQFTDLKKGTRISMRLWMKEKTLYNDMDRLDIVTLIQCCE